MQLDRLLAMPRLGLSPVVTADAPRIRGVYTTDLPDPGRYLDGGELVLTSTTWYHEPRDADVFVAALSGAGVAALVAGTAGVGVLPDALRDACARHRLTLLAVEDEVSFAALTETVLAALDGAERRAPSAGLHRGLVASMASGAGAEGLVDVFARATGVWCAVLSATGRPIAGGVPEVTGQQLARAHRDALAAGGFPAVRALSGGGELTLFPVQSPVAHRPPAGYLAASGDHRDWAPGVSDAAWEVCALLALDKTAVQERRRIEARFLREAVDLLAAGQETAAEARLRGLGLGDSALGALYLSTTGSPYGAELAATVLEDVADRVPGCSAAIPVDDGAYLLLVPEGTDGVAEAAERLAPLIGHGRAALGTGSPATGAAALRRSVDEARHAHRVAALGTGTVRTAGSDELSSHLLLIAAVPDDVRRLYRDRLIGVLERYDTEHGSELVATLSAFLDASGSWQRCAEQLHVHVNTLRYRLRRVEQLTGHSLATLRDRVDFCLALSIG
ncbi:PucR family transcriptional regulator [Streptomyces sp. SID8379]|uniref:PucR family transcriptional regulator n=1 Tax=unclassified Streptomyces TaxID=2593676 RepID=UPI000382E51D|nr:PucR family transcriptional regulator [Streptomyces sp. HmicA12]MYW63039.1 PucR family transcriptional regulator [Streptomyces sp. SID8379]